MQKTMMVRKLLCLLCVAALMPLGVAAASDVPTSMRVALVSDPNVELYPLRVMDRDILSMLGLVYESLMVLDDTRNPVPSIASSYDVLSDGRTWIFHIRDGVYFHDGQELRASDVAATMDAIRAIALDESIPANQKGMYVNLSNVCSSWQATDDYTLTVTTERPCYGLLYAMTFPILQAQTINDPMPPGTGPYRIEYYLPGDELWLVGNQGWYGPTPHVSEIAGIFYSDIEAALSAFEAEDIDIIMTRSTSAVRYRGTASSRVNSYDYATRQLECLMMNYYSHLKDDAMRKAVAYAINKSRLVSNVYQNMVTATDTLQSPGSWLYYDRTVTYSYDPDYANELLDGLGWENIGDDGYRFRKTESGETKVLELRVCYYEEAGSSLRKEVASEISTMLAAVGIKTRILPYTFDQGAQKLLARDYDLFLCSYNFDVVPDPNFLLLSNGYGNYVGYKSDKMNELCKNLRKADTSNAFQVGWYEIQKQAASDLPFLPLYWRNGVVLSRYPFSSIRDIREFELLRSINEYK